VSKKVVLLDYGSGNIRSGERALQRVGADVTVTADFDAACNADGLLVPGVGAFEACMTGLKAVRGDVAVDRRLTGGRPVLGICVGMQILFARGIEHGVETEGCEQWPGTVERLQPKDDQPVPHMGWNTVDVPSGTKLFDGIEKERFYFVRRSRVAAAGRPRVGRAARDVDDVRRRSFRRRRRERPAVRHPVPPGEVR
jgi:glutamine amidotransferase